MVTFAVCPPSCRSAISVASSKQGAQLGRHLGQRLGAMAMGARYPCSPVWRCTKLTLPISGSGPGKSSRVCPPRDSLRLSAPWATAMDVVIMDGRSVARFQPGL